MVEAVPIVPLRGSRVTIHTDLNLNEEVKIGVILELVPNQSARAVYVCILEVEFP